MRIVTGLLVAALLAGCNKPQNMQGMASPETTPMSDLAQQPPPGIVAPLQNTRSQIAYTYGLGYSLADGAVATVQARHVAACAALGSLRCRIGSTNLNSSSDPAGYTTGRAVFLIDARLARAFIAKLDAATESAGGRVADRKVEAEDLTKQIVDTDARVRAKQALAERLVTLIKSANAKVGELVEAERAFSETQEELDAARQLQAALRQRVAMSEVTADYTSTAATGPWGPVTQSLRSTGGTLATSIAVLVTFVVAALPWALLLVLLIWIGRRRGWRLRWPWRRRSDPPAA